MLIVDMPMPEDCVYCPMSHWNKIDEFTGCEVAPGKLYAATKDKEYAESVGRPDWCPIKGELVRCGECRRAIPFSVAGNRDAFCHCDLFDVTMTRNDFCNYGERKEKEK